MDPCRGPLCFAGILTICIKTCYEKYLHGVQQTGGNLSRQVPKILMQSGLRKRNHWLFCGNVSNKSESSKDLPELRGQNWEFWGVTYSNSLHTGPLVHGQVPERRAFRKQRVSFLLESFWTDRGFPQVLRGTSISTSHEENTWCKEGAILMQQDNP